jgi:acetate kinase
MSSGNNVQRDLILSVNSGSSSLKITLFSILPQEKRGDKNVELVLNGSLSSISSPPVQAKLQSATDETVNKSEEVGQEQIKDHESAFEWFLKNLKEVASIDRERIGWICHRVVHGGDYTGPVVITKDSYHHIEDLSDLAPL